LQSDDSDCFVRSEVTDPASPDLRLVSEFMHDFPLEFTALGRWIDENRY
jgi:hypothetical protein